MSDEPQPQQPNDGVAPKRPLPAGGPGTPGGRKPHSPTPDPTAPPAQGADRPAGRPGGSGKPQSAEGPERAPGTGRAAEATAGSPEPDRGPARDSRPDTGRAASASRSDGGGRPASAPRDGSGAEGSASRGGTGTSGPVPADGSGAADSGAPDRTASVARARQAARGARPEQTRPTSTGAGAASGGTPAPGRGPVSGGGPASGAAAGSGKGAAGKGPGGKKPAGPEGPGGNEPASAESTQVLRRITPPKGPQATKADDAAQAPETTQVLRRVNAPRAGEPGGPAAAAAKPDPSGRTPRPTVPRPGGPNRAAETGAGAAAASASGAAAGSSPAAARAARAARAAGTVGAAGAGAQAASASGAGAGAAAASASGAAAGSSPAAARAARAARAAGTAGAQAAKPGAASPEDQTTLLAAADAETTAGNGNGNGNDNGKAKAKKGKRPKRTGWRRIIPTWRMVLGTFVVGVLLVIGLFFLGYSLVKIPPANAFATKQSNVYLYADGSQLARDGEVNRENVSLAQVSKDAQHAVLAAEDRDFYTESAVDPKAMIRAAWNTATGKGKQSGSTITQQYVKNYYLAQEQTVTRKAKEFFISIKLDQNKSKDEILEGYLNTSYFGRNAYGIQAAAQAYYGKDAADLDPARAAYLAALVNAPSEYDVVAHPENKKAALARWNYVLDGMVTKGWLDESKRTGMKFPMPKEQTISTGMSGQRGYLVEAVKHYLTTNNIIDADHLALGGYRITTTIQKNRQDAFVKAVDDQLMSKLDKKNRKADTYVRAGGASVDPKTGKVVAMYGGIDYVKQYTNGATRGDFQVGSTFKPFVFTSAVQNGSTTQDGRTITPNTVYDGTNQRPVQGWSGGAYAPENEDQRSYGPITVRKATDLSVNSVYAQMAVDVGPAKVKQTAIDLGVPSDTPDLQPYPSIALGTATASVLDMAEAYATLANHGKHGTYTLVEKITKEGTEEVKLPEEPAKQAVSREAADTTTSVLQSVVQSGTATAAQAAGRPAAGKTGTAESDTAAWFAGYTPDLATVVSVMGQDPVTAKHQPLYGALGQARMNGGGPPTQIWAQYTRDALKGKPVSEFDLQLEQGADVVQEPPATSSAQPGTDGGTDDGGATAKPTDGGATATPTDGGTTGTPADGGATGTPTDGGTTTDGGATTTGGTTTDGGTTTGGGTTGGDAAGGGAATGGGASTDGGGGTTGTDTGSGGFPGT